MNKNILPVLRDISNSLSGTDESMIRDRSVESIKTLYSKNEDSPYRKQIRDRVMEYCKPQEGNVKPLKKLVFSKIDKGMLSEAELRELLFLEIQENKKFLEQRQSKAHGKRKSVSIGKEPIDDSQKDDTAGFKSIRISNQNLSINPSYTHVGKLTSSNPRRNKFFKRNSESNRSRR